MNFREIRQEIFSALDYNPDLAAYRDQVSRVVNRHYQQVSTQYPWLFLQKVAKLSLKATVSGSAAATISSPATGAAGSAITDNGRIVTLTATDGTVFSADMEGQTLVDGTDEYTVQQFISTTRLMLSTTPVTRFNASTTWSIQYRRYPVPDLATEILGIMSRDDDRGRLLYIDRRKEEEHFLDRDTTGDPVVFIEDEHQQDQSPTLAPTLAAATGGTGTGGALLNSTEYQYCYTHHREGRETPPSLVSSVTTPTTGTPVITVNGLDEVRWYDDTSNNQYRDSGVVTNIYRRDKTNNGPWVRVAELPSTDTNGYQDDELFSGFNTGQNAAISYNQGDYLILDYQQPRPYLRAWYTAASDLDVELRYLIGLRRLHADSDVPEWPVAYHHLLVYSSLADICLMNGMTQQAGIYESRAKRLLDNMRAKYLARNDRILIRRGFERHLLERERWGIPSKTG